MRRNRTFVLSTDPLADDSNRADAVPIFAVLAEEPVFGQIARDAQARFLMHGRHDNAVEVVSLQQLLTGAGLVF
jgi:hypothetical protein